MLAYAADRKAGAVRPVYAGLSGGDAPSAYQPMASDHRHSPPSQRAAQAPRKPAAPLDFHIWEAEHRIKNHLQLLSSYARVMGSRPGMTIEAFSRELAEKLAAIASAHEALQGVGSTEIVAARPLLESLSKPYRDGAHSIELNCAPSLELAPAHLGPIGMIVSEAVANALKHAFAPGQSGRILVTLRARGEELELRISDNRRGFPPQRAARAGGLELILALTQRLRGALHLDTGPLGGAELRITFPGAMVDRAARDDF